MHRPPGFDRGRRIGEPPLPLGLVRRLGRRGQPPFPERPGEEVVDLGAECARLIERDGWSNQPEWCRAEGGDPGYAVRHAGGMGARGRYGLGASSPVPGSLGWVPPSVKIQGIPREVAAPTVSSRTWRAIKIRKDRLGTVDTMRLMGEMALESATDPVFIEDARSIARECPSRDYRCVMSGILEFVRRRIRYQEGPLGETVEGGIVYQYVMSPGFLLYLAGQGLCADMTTLIDGLLLSVGINAGMRAVFLDPDRPKGASHIYAMGISKDGTFAVDPVPEGSVPGDEPPRSQWVASPIDYEIPVS